MSLAVGKYKLIPRHKLIEDQQVFRLGRISFTVKTDDCSFEQQLPKVLPVCDAKEDMVYEIEATNNYRELISEVIKLQSDYLWLSAACIMSPQGHKVLISGHSNAGKSTTALALAMANGWKVLSEDLTCIDLKTNKILAFSTPFSLKTGTIEILQKTINIVPEPVVFSEWVPLNDFHVQGEYKAEFDLSLFFGKAVYGEPLIQVPCSFGKYIRLCLPCSNLIYFQDGPDKLTEYIGSGECYEVMGGTLAERMELIIGLTEKKPTLVAASQKEITTNGR
jgi:hypothetical protein